MEGWEVASSGQWVASMLVFKGIIVHWFGSTHYSLLATRYSLLFLPPMKAKHAVIVMLIVCLLLAWLLLLHRIPPTGAGLVFAAMLVVTGIASAGFRK